MRMSMSDRFLTVVVFYAALGLCLAISDVLLPSLGLFSLWLDSGLLKVAIFAVLWLLAPVLGQRFVKREDDESS